MAKTINVRLTEYFPFQAGMTAAQQQMEGGVFDRLGKPLYALEDYLEGNAPYVSLACDSNGGPPGNLPEFRTYGATVWLPELALNIKKYVDNAPDGLLFIPFALVDTGGNFLGGNKQIRVAGYEPIDVCRRERPAPDKSFSGMLTTLSIFKITEMF
jgi:hypothetical protein